MGLHAYFTVTIFDGVIVPLVDRLNNQNTLAYLITSSRSTDQKFGQPCQVGFSQQIFMPQL